MNDDVPGALGCLIPPWRGRFRPRLRGLPPPSSPRTYAMGSSSRALHSPPEFPEPQPSKPRGLERLPWGFNPHRDIHRRSPLTRRLLLEAGVSRVSQTRFVPSSTFLTSSTAYSSDGCVGLFHPTATSGIRSSGGSPHTELYELVARRCPHVVGAGCLHPVTQMRQ